MPAEVLVMCAQCGRPQKPAPACTACGAALPEPPVRAPRSGRDQLLEAYSPFLEGDLGGGRKLLLSERRLEWTGKPPLAVELSELRAARLGARPAWEALLFCGLSVSVGAFVPGWPRVALGALFLLAAAACFLQRRYALVLARRDGRSAELFFGFARLGSDKARQLRGVYASLATELRERGVEAAP